MGKTINELVQEAHLNAKVHGWHDEQRSFGDLIALCHTELSEALEEFRKGHQPSNTRYDCKAQKSTVDCDSDCGSCDFGKPQGIPSELADVCIRIFDMAGLYGIDLDQAIAEKMNFNRNRPFRHGGKVL